MSSILCFDPTSTSGSDGYINYKMSGRGSCGSSGRGPGCGIWLWIFIILFVLELIGKLS